ncbi:PLAC8-domain-containing protein [Gonapodya prolifera JEL478]|uniref:PLAC8-domain-containing protein n=1 Tax=Gonapodya prolifera (strain JEL478) TaxID=1344416 RepID=A0A139ACH1_GONPJ|nr:PLAC8-domain-containing protein [Gonapodya prolifera JEL478]|eukprot:KXS14512.1 PLAC8-domain-containing protein [Gonapodya prolifera JEL478]
MDLRLGRHLDGRALLHVRGARRVRRGLHGCRRRVPGMDIVRGCVGDSVCGAEGKEQGRIWSDGDGSWRRCVCRGAWADNRRSFRLPILSGTPYGIKRRLCPYSSPTRGTSSFFPFPFFQLLTNLPSTTHNSFAPPPLHTHIHHTLQGEKGWDRDLFSCFDDPALCLVAWFVPCVTHGQIMEEDGQGTCLESGVIFGILGMLGLSPCLACFRRRRVREKRGIPGDNMTDFCTVCWCHPCAALQELNEVTKYPVAESLSSHSFIQFTVTPPSPLPPPSPVTAGPSHDSPVYSAPPVYAYAAPHQPQPKSSAPPPLPTDLPGYVPRGGK